MSLITALCDRCRPIFNTTISHIEWPTGSATTTGQWHPSVVSLQESAETGCRLCADVWHEVVNQEWPEPRNWMSLSEPLEYTVGVGYKHTIEEVPVSSSDLPSGLYVEFAAHTNFDIDEPYSIDNSPGSNEPLGDTKMRDSYDGLSQTRAIIKDGLTVDKRKRKDSWVFGLHQFRHCDQATEILVEANGKALGTSWTSDLTMAKQWHAQCLNEHTTCGRTNDDANVLPTRLLEISANGRHRKARLVESVHIPPNSKYLSLSHCWGKQPIFSLLLGNINDLREDIPISKLPRTFQDAFEVTTQLGYSYLWIDSLCIVQDEPSDWAREADRMGDVYENASLNIAATAFLSSASGLFVPKSADKPKLLTASVDMRLGDFHLTGTFELVQERAWTSRVDKAPLNKRAWVTQERFLSPRKLHFGRDQLLWECHQLQACEMLPLGLDKSMINSKYDGFTSYRDIVSIKFSNHHHIAWYRIIDAYTKSTLTYPSDKLAAIAGITSKYQELLSDRCVAGLWEKTFVMDLMWCRAWSERRELSRALDGRAPTWSWACLNYQIFHPLANLRSELVATVRSVQDHSYHTTLERHLYIKAPLAKAYHQDKLTPGDLAAQKTFRLKNHVLEIRARFDGSPEDFEGIIMTPDEEATLSNNDINISTAGYNPGVWVYMLFAISSGPTAGIILRRLPQPGHYSRIGYFDTFFNPVDLMACDISPLEKYLEDSFEIVEDDYGESHGEGIFSVTIV